MIAFRLTLPGVASWDGRWSGEGRCYVIVRRVPKQDEPRILENGPYRYSWPDGWAACVHVTKVDGREAAKLRRRSNGFCGYDWMVDSIIAHGDIRT